MMVMRAPPVKEMSVSLPDHSADPDPVRACRRKVGLRELRRSRATLDGRWIVRVSVGALPTERTDVEALWAVMHREAEGGG
jgi:hypothetical protein